MFLLPSKSVLMREIARTGRLRRNLSKLDDAAV